MGLLVRSEPTVPKRTLNVLEDAVEASAAEISSVVRQWFPWILKARYAKVQNSGHEDLFFRVLQAHGDHKDWMNDFDWSRQLGGGGSRNLKLQMCP